MGMFLSEYEIFLINELIERRIRPRKNAPKPNLRVRFMSKMTQNMALFPYFSRYLRNLKSFLLFKMGPMNC